MSIESFGLVEHFDYMCKYIPQPFIIHSESVVSLSKLNDDDYAIKTGKEVYTLTKATLKKLVDALGIKIKLFSAVSDEDDVLDLVLPAANKLFKCFADCFVFYNKSEDPYTIIDLNVNNTRGTEGTKYENGPSPWKIDIRKQPENFTCFACFMGRFEITEDRSDILVKADDIMSSSSNVTINLFKEKADSRLQPMLTMSSRFSNMNGFTDIHPTLYDKDTDTEITFPMNYGSHNNMSTFDDMWKKVTHLLETTDLDDYIFREVNELAASNETPNSIKNFISDIVVDSTLNINQPIHLILQEAADLTSNMRAAKARNFKKKLGSLISWCLCMKHSGCSSCGHLELD